MQNTDEYKVLKAKILLYGVQFCGVMYMKDTCGELHTHQFNYRIIIINIHINCMLMHYYVLTKWIY